jgi:ferredoxin-NADP reductase
MELIDSFLNKITMYRLTFLGLTSLAILTIFFAFLGWMPYTALDLLLSLIALLIAAWATNAACALLVKATPTPEAAFITALILFFILTPLASAGDALILMLVAAIAMVSKYVIVWKKKHLFNPTAFGVFVLTILGSGVAIWWVAMPLLLPFVAVLGLLMVRKLRRFDLLLSFAIAAIVVYVGRSVVEGVNLVTALQQFFTSWPLVFFGTIMLTEPQTMPPVSSDRVVYGALVGFLFSIPFTYGTFSTTPELALLVGNVYSWFVSMHKRVMLRFSNSSELSRGTYELVFVPDDPFKFESGQYMEWTSPHQKNDKRGIRRYFTISSAPADPFVRLGVRIPVEGSTFKDSLRDLKKDDVITATNVAGGFTLPHDPKQKIACIAGGIGITPFISMFRDLAMRHERRDISLIYAAATPLDFAYQEEIDSFKDSIGLKVIYLPTDFTEVTGWSGPSGYVTNVLIQNSVPDYLSRHWYLSGPEAMVKNYKWLMRGMNVPSRLIKTDYFPGF